MESQNNKTTITSENDDTSGCIFALIFIGIIVFIIISISSSAKKDAEARKQRELREFNNQLNQDPSSWNKEQRDRYNSFIEWDMQNEK